MKKNYAKFNFNELKVLFGEDIRFSADGDSVFTGVSTDTRTIETGNIFVGLKGENFDGNSRVNEAFAKGAAIAILDIDYYDANREKIGNNQVIAVKSTLQALGRLARFHRDRFTLPVIAIGGSNGKTTTKEMCSAILAAKYNVLKTEANYNNQIGVPLTLLQLDNTYEIAVIEIGTNEPGEIATLTSIVQPTHGLLTNIGREHLEKLLNLDGVEMEETFLFGHLKKQNGLAFLNLDDERIKKYRRILDKNLTYGTDKETEIHATVTFNEKLQAHLSITDKSLNGDGERTLEIKLNATGYAAAQNAIAAVAVGIQLAVPISDIIATLEKYTQDDSHGYARMVLQEANGVKILNDCYNANPDSMRMALLTLKEIQTDGKKFIALGDMRELGDASEEEHISLLNECIVHFENIFVIGAEMNSAAKKINSNNIKSFDTHKELYDTLKTELARGDTILVKGSRGMEMERIIKFLTE